MHDKKNNFINAAVISLMHLLLLGMVVAEVEDLLALECLL